MSRAKGKKTSLKQLSTHTHKGRRTPQQPSNGSVGRNPNAAAKLTAPVMMGTKMMPTPNGPERGFYGGKHGR